jgi:sulfotransferase family protein
VRVADICCGRSCVPLAVAQSQRFSREPIDRRACLNRSPCFNGKANLRIVRCGPTDQRGLLSSNMPRQGPTFIIAGAPRSGTTWLYELLDRHPDVYMAKPARPEPKFFLVDELYTLGIQHYYDKWFREAGVYPAAGEKSTNYLESSRAAERINAHVPHVKLVFILREPAHRAYSNWAWSVMNGLETEDFETAVAKEDERERSVPPSLRYARPHAYFSRGLYAQLLRPYLQLFPRDRVLCLKFDEIVRNPCELAVRLHRFIDVTPRPSDAAGLDVVNPSEKRGEAMPHDVIDRLRRRYTASNRELAALVGPEFAEWENR